MAEQRRVWVRSGIGIVGIFLAAAVVAVACGGEGGDPEGQPCESHAECPETHACDEVGACVEVDPLTIESEALPEGRLGADYVATLEAAGGFPPYTWRAEGLPGWASLDGSTGVLEGVPDVAAHLEIEIGVTDDRGVTDDVVLELLVLACEPGASLPCTVPDEDVCLVGTAECDDEGVFGECVLPGEPDPSTDPLACGADCGVCPDAAPDCVGGSCTCGDDGVCAPNELCCETGCVDPDRDPDHCGGCDAACPGPDGPNQIATCSFGSCGLACEEGFRDCDDGVDGCETDVRTDVANCGGCGQGCEPLANVSELACVDGGCAIGVCESGFDSCDSEVDTGCETHTDSHVNHCGSCGNDCEAQANNNIHGTLECVGGGCDVSCPSGRLDCDDDFRTGCETSFSTSNCGECGRTCSLNSGATGTATCTSGGNCSVNCPFNRASCDGNYQTGCETFTNTNQNCGSCGNSCGGGEQCSGGSCCSMTGVACDPGNHNCCSGSCGGCVPGTPGCVTTCS